MFEFIERNAVRLGALVILSAFAVALLIFADRASASSGRLVYRPNDPSAPRIIILGSGYGSAEDSVALRLVDYDPSNNRVVYRVVVP